MRILNTKRAVALVVALRALMMETGSLAVSAGPRSQSAPQAELPGGAQELAMEVGQKPRESTISVETALVNLDVLVTDQDGHVLSGLKRENFRVLDNGKPQAITHFAPASAPITIAMLMEYSGSAYNYFAYKAASWGSSFLNHLDPLDWVALVTYDIKPTIQQDFTRNKAQVQETLGSLCYPQFREANMYDAIVDTLDRLDRVKGKKAVVLISTGANTMSAGTLDDTLRRIRQSDVTVFSVGVAESEHLATGGTIGYLQAKNQLQTFAKLSGGSAWFPRFEAEIPDIFKSVAAFLRGQYSIGFSPQHLAHDGKYHKLRVEMVQPDGNPLIVSDPKGKRRKLIVYTREGYMAPSEPTAVLQEK
jgi:VWFA-related protein